MLGGGLSVVIWHARFSMHYKIFKVDSLINIGYKITFAPSIPSIPPPCPPGSLMGIGMHINKPIWAIKSKLAVDCTFPTFCPLVIVIFSSKRRSNLNHSYNIFKFYVPSTCG